MGGEVARYLKTIAQLSLSDQVDRHAHRAQAANVVLCRAMNTLRLSDVTRTSRTHLHGSM